MSDQVVEQSPQSRLEAMLGDNIVPDMQPTEAPEEKEQGRLLQPGKIHAPCSGKNPECGPG